MLIVKVPLPGINKFKKTSIYIATGEASEPQTTNFIAVALLNLKMQTEL